VRRRVWRRKRSSRRGRGRGSTQGQGERRGEVKGNAPWSDNREIRHPFFGEFQFT
jgi:hypothetical protein